MTSKRSHFRTLSSLSVVGLSAFTITLACAPTPPGGQTDGVGGTAPLDGSGSGGTGTPGVGGATPGVGGLPGGTGGAGNPGSGGVGNPGSGGSAGTGSAPGTGGTPGTGGAPVVVERPPLVTSAQGSACSPTLEGCSYWKTDGAVTESTGNAEVTVSETTKQVFVGFGGAFNEEGWQVLLDLTAEERAKAMALLFDAATGANFVYGRIPIGASDYAVAPRYSLQESASAAFSIERDKNLFIPFIHAAQLASLRIHFAG